MLLLLLCCCYCGDVVVVHFMRFFSLRGFCPVNGVLHLADQQEGNTVQDIVVIMFEYVSMNVQLVEKGGWEVCVGLVVYNL